MRKMVQAAALLAGFSAASTAAAQTANPAPAPDATPSTPATPASTTAPATPSGPGTAAGAADPAVPAPTPARPTPLPWRQTQLLATFGMSLSTIDPSLTLYANRTVDMSLAIRPRWTFNRMLQLRAGIAFSTEFTNADNTTTRNEPRFGDMNIDLWFTGIPPVGGAVKFWVAPRLIFPVSVESRARTMIFTPGLVVQAAYAIEHVLGGELAIIGNATVTSPLYQEGEVTRRTPPSYSVPCYGAVDANCAQALGGLQNVAATFSWALVLAQSWEHISPGMFFSMQHLFPYRGAAVSGMAGQAPLAESPAVVRQNSIFAAWVDWIATPWFTAEVGYQVFRNVLDADGTYGNPFYAPNQDSRFYLQTVFSLDKIYEIAAGRGGGGGGVIRTRNDQRPQGRFGLL